MSFYGNSLVEMEVDTELRGIYTKWQGFWRMKRLYVV